MHLIVHIIQRSILFHHNWLGEYINMPTFLLWISCQNLLDHSVKFPGNRTARFPIDWPGGREEKRKRRGWGIKSVDFKCPFIPPWLRFMSSCFQSEYFEIKDPHRSALKEERAAASNPMAISCNELWQHYCTMLHKYVTVKPESEKEEKEGKEGTVARFWSLIVRLGSSKRMMRALHAASGWIQGHRLLEKHEISPERNPETSQEHTTLCYLVI